MIKEEQIVKLVTVTITDIFAQNELVTHKLTAVEFHDDVVSIKFLIENSTLPKTHNPSYKRDLHVDDLQGWVEEGVDEFVERLEFELFNAIRVKTERED